MKIANNLKFSTKHLQIDKSNARITLIVSLAVAVVVFSIVASVMLIKQITYQNKVKDLRTSANDQLAKNIKAATPLVASYQSFDNATESVIGNNVKNSKIILDALPSKYDFPALTSSIELLASQSGLKLQSITGTDQELTAEQNSASPAPVAIPYSVTVNGNYDNVKKFVSILEKSIRPMAVKSIQISGKDNNMTATINVETFYQPARKLEIKQTVIKSSGATTTKTTVKKGATK